MARARGSKKVSAGKVQIARPTFRARTAFIRHPIRYSKLWARVKYKGQPRTGQILRKNIRWQWNPFKRR